VQQLIDQHLADAKLGFKTRKNYRSQADKHIVPCIGRQKVRTVDARVTDSFYSELRRCRDHCNGRLQVQHRTNQQHECDERCRTHVCKPLSETSILYIHQILSGGLVPGERGQPGEGLGVAVARRLGLDGVEVPVDGLRDALAAGAGGRGGELEDRHRGLPR
jgi:hypothetical protein